MTTTTTPHGYDEHGAHSHADTLAGCGTQDLTARTGLVPLADLPDHAMDELVRAQFLTASALRMMQDPTVDVAEVLANVDAACDIYSAMAASPERSS
jgi:hypothetical protein